MVRIGSMTALLSSFFGSVNTGSKCRASGHNPQGARTCRAACLDVFRLGRGDRAGNLHQLAVLLTRQALQMLKRLRLAQGTTLHEHALGSLNDLALFQGLPQIGGLSAQ